MFWSEATFDLLDPGLGTGVARTWFDHAPIRHNGELLYVDYRTNCLRADGATPDGWSCLLMVSRDNGRSFQKRSILATGRVFEPMLADTAEGERVCVIRGADQDQRPMLITHTCGYTNLLPMSDNEALLVYSDFLHVGPDGLPCKSVEVRRIDYGQSIKEWANQRDDKKLDAEHGRVCRCRDEKSGYVGWPTVARLGGRRVLVRGVALGNRSSLNTDSRVEGTFGSGQPDKRRG